MKRRFSEELVFFIIAIYLICFYFKKSQIAPWLTLIDKIDMFTVSSGRFNQAMGRMAKRTTRTPLSKVYNVFAFVRDYFLLMFAWYFMLQFFQIGFGEMSMAELSIDFLTQNLIFDLSRDLVILTVFELLGLRDQLDLVASNIGGYMRVHKSMGLYGKKKREYVVDSKDIEMKYLDHFLRNAFNG